VLSIVCYNILPITPFILLLTHSAQSGIYFFLFFLIRLGGVWTTSLKTFAMDITSFRFLKSSLAITWYFVFVVEYLGVG
jgi:hypothetical protein